MSEEYTRKIQNDENIDTGKESVNSVNTGNEHVNTPNVNTENGQVNLGHSAAGNGQSNIGNPNMENRQPNTGNLGSSYQGGNQYYQSTARQYQTPNNHAQMPKRKKERNPRKGLKLVASAMAFGLIAGITFQGVNVVGNRLFNKSDTSVSQEIGSTVQSDTPSSNSGSTISVAKTDVATVADTAMPSIVSITNMSVGEVQSWFGVQSQELKSAGSGIIVGENDSELLIATNNHVIEGAQTLTVTFADDSSVEAKLKGTDADNDVAVIAVSLSDIEDSTKSAIKIATLGDSDSLSVGEPAIAIGNALGYGQSVTAGIVSATNRTFSDASLSGTYIQTDAAINPGNSGGALLNAAGEVIGINVAKEASSEVDSMGYAIPISVAKPILDELMNRETRELVDEDQRGALGIYGTDVDSATAEAYNMPMGIYISKLVSGGAAEKAGLLSGDIITELDGISVSTMTSLKNQLAYYRTGETITVTIQRAQNGQYETQKIDVLLQSADSLTTAEHGSGQDSEETTPEEENGYGESGGNRGGSAPSWNDLFNFGW